MAIKGSLKEASLPDVLQLLSMGKKTGCLGLSLHDSFGSIYFDGGRICHAANASSQRNKAPRAGEVGDGFGPGTMIAAMGAFQLGGSCSLPARTSTLQHSIDSKFPQQRPRNMGPLPLLHIVASFMLSH